MGQFLTDNKNPLKNSLKPLPSQVFEIIEFFLDTVQYGQLILVIQDGIVVKIEKIEKYIISAKSREARCVKVDKSLKNHPLQTKILTELQSIKYGQLVILLYNGHVEQIEKTEKKRINELEGLYGDGI